MTTDFGYLLLFVIAALGFISAVLFAARLLRPDRPNVEKNSTYESGEAPVGNAGVQFNIRFYVIALVFVLFEVELVFLFPWATVFGQATLIHATGGQWGWFALGEMTIFVGLLALGLGYVWAKGYLDWLKPDPKQPTVGTRVPADLYQKVNRKYRPPTLLLLLAFSLITSHVSAQELKIFRAVVMVSDGVYLDGILYDVTDSTLVLAPNTPSVSIAQFRADSLPLLSVVDSRNIKWILIHRKRHGWRGVRTGVAAGIAASLFVAFGTKSDDEHPGSFMLVPARAGFIVGGPFIGAGLGVITSTVPRRTIKILQKPTLFRLAGPKLRRYAIRGQRPDLTVVP